MCVANPFANTPVKLEGAEMPEILAGEVVRSHPETFTVDVASDHDRRFWEGVQVLSPYMHQAGGAGFTVMPEEGAKVMLIIPSDSSPPCVLGFRAPNRPPAPADDQEGTLDPQKQARTPVAQPRFDGNRPPHPRSTQSWMGPDNQGIVLHPGGILETRSGGFNADLYFDDGSRRSFYRAKEAVWPGGSVHEKQRKVGTQERYETTHVARHKPADAQASMRVRYGGQPLGEPSSKDVSWKALAGSIDATEDDMAMEVAVIPQGFSTQDGQPAKGNSFESSVMRVLTTLTGTLLLRFVRVGLRVLKRMRIEVGEDFVLKGKKGSLEFSEELSLGGKSTTNISGSQIRLGGGKRGVMAQGDVCMFTIPPGTAVEGLLEGAKFIGVFTGVGPPIAATMVSPGSPTVKVP